LPKILRYLIVAANKNLASSDKRNSQRLKSIKQQIHIIQANIQRRHDKKATSTNYLHRTCIIYSITPVLSMVILLNFVNLIDISSASKGMQTTALIVEETIEKR
jgi:hypothetical protein